MGIWIQVVDTTGTCPPSTLYIEGKLTYRDLKQKALDSLQLKDSAYVLDIEIKDEHNEPTKKITSKCAIFVAFKKNLSDSSEYFDEMKKDTEDAFGKNIYKGFDALKDLFGGKPKKKK